MDIVERLKQGEQPLLSFVMEEAADEIERLRIELAMRERAWDIACCSGIAGPEDGWVCCLCWGDKEESGSFTTIYTELLHENGERQRVNITCPRCGGSGIEPGEVLPDSILLYPGDEVIEVGGYEDKTGAYVKIRRSEGKIEVHKSTLPQARSLGKRLYQVTGGE